MRCIVLRLGFRADRGSSTSRPIPCRNTICSRAPNAVAEHSLLLSCSNQEFSSVPYSYTIHSIYSGKHSYGLQVRLRHWHLCLHRLNLNCGRENLSSSPANQNPDKRPKRHHLIATARTRQRSWHLSSAETSPWIMLVR